jgi:hypothetical protein
MRETLQNLVDRGSNVSTSFPYHGYMLTNGTTTLSTLIRPLIADIYSKPFGFRLGAARVEQ